MARYGYARVSTREQNLARQIEALQAENCDRIFEEKQSGKNLTDREVLKNVLEYTLQEGDELVICDFSRLARNTKDLIEIAETVKSKGATLRSLKEQLDLSSPMGVMVMTVLASIYQMERETILTRQAEGIAIAKREGKYRGRKPQEYDKTLFDALYEQYKVGKITKCKFANMMHTSRPTLDKWISEHEAA